MKNLSPSRDESMTGYETEVTTLSDSEIDFGAVEGLPTPLRLPRMPLGQTCKPEIKEQVLLSSVHTGLDEAPFVPEGDLPKRRCRGNTRFHRLRPKVESDTETKLENQNGVAETNYDPTEVSETQSAHRQIRSRRKQTAGLDRSEAHAEGPSADSESGKPVEKACSKCRKKHTKCVHRIAGSRQKRKKVPIKDRPLVLQQHIPTSGKPKKDGTLYQRNLHDRSSGPSMTTNAVDYRRRKVTEKEYKDCLMAHFHGDIVEQVDEEGGITPLGRLFKAGVRTFERDRSRQSDDLQYQDSMEIELRRLNGEVEQWRHRCLTAERKIVNIKEEKLNSMI